MAGGELGKSCISDDRYHSLTGKTTQRGGSDCGACPGPPQDWGRGRVQGVLCGGVLCNCACLPFPLEADLLSPYQPSAHLFLGLGHLPG